MGKYLIGSDSRRGIGDIEAQLLTPGYRVFSGVVGAACLWAECPVEA